MKVREVIVVEGIHDEAALKKYFDCDVIAVHGLALDERTLDMIRTAQQTRGVIILTDPDAPGNRIRERIDQAVPGCKHAFVNKKQARTARKVGVEHAPEEVIREALEHLMSYTDDEGDLSAADMYELGLSGQPDSRRKRTVLGERLHLGYANAGTMRRRLNGAGITKEEIRGILNE